MTGIVKNLMLPSGLIASCFFIGMIFLFISKRRRIGGFLLATAGLIYAVFGSGGISFWLLGNLENQYPPLALTERIKGVKSIVVLSGHGWDDPRLPLSSRVNSASAFRIIEALRLFGGLPGSEILISGGEKVPQIMKNLFISLGVPSEKIWIEDGSQNTYENAFEVRKKVGNESFVLVTSAGHMPRAMKVFQRLGMNPIPAPTHYMSLRDFYPFGYLPSPIHLEYSDFAVHEYIGIAWYWIKKYS